MPLYDIIMLIVLVGAVIFGAWKGFAWQVASLAAIFASYFVAITFKTPVAAMINTEEPWNRFIASFILFVGTALLVWIAFGFASRSMEKMELKGFDRQIGAILGAVKGGLLCLVITFFAMTLLTSKQKHAIATSYSGNYMSQAISKLKPILPEGVDEAVSEYLERLDKELNTDHRLANEGVQLEDQVKQTAAKAVVDRVGFVFGTNQNGNASSSPTNNGQTSNGVNEYPAGGFDNSIPADPSKIDWRNYDWKREAEAFGNRVN